ncbi:hypothetical protein Tco_0377325 [Tanacetum coccineum]
MTYPHPNRRFVPQAVLTKSSKINIAGASVNTIVRPGNTAGSKPTVNHPRSISNAYKRGYSQVTRPFNKYSEYKNSIFNKKVNTVRVKDTTARDRAAVSKNKGKGVNAVRGNQLLGNPHQKEYKEKGFIDNDGKGRISGKDGVAEMRNRTLDRGGKNYEHKLMVLRELEITLLQVKLEKTELKQKYILIPICTTDPLISQGPKNYEEDSGMKPTQMDESGALDKDRDDDQATRSEFERLLQQEK